MDSHKDFSMKFIDLRSDTVTHPTQKMREAMYNACVGDDVYGDDPTVIELEVLSAELMGKEAALFVPTGVFGNQLSVFTHCDRGDEVIVSRNCHIFKSETGALSVIPGVQSLSLVTNKGLLDPKEVEAAIRCPVDEVEIIHQPRTKLLCLENALSTGLVVPLETMETLYKIAKKHNLKVHLDGARIFNAAISLGCSAKDIAQYCDSVMFCLSKGLCSPVGSIIAGTKEFINAARKKRKLMGGGMRQVGVLAACGLISLKEHVGYLGEDHRIAKLLCEKMKEIKEVEVFPDDVQINFVFFKINVDVDPHNLQEFLKKEGIFTELQPRGGGLHRLVTHYYIREKEVLLFVEKVKKFFEGLKK